MQKKPAGTGPPLNAPEIIPRRRFLPLLQSRAALGVIIFLLAFGVRVFSWHDTRLEVGKVQTAVVADYQRVAQLLRAGGVSSFFSSSSPLADLNNFGHPPGYSVLLAVIYSINQSSNAIQFVQITADAFSAVLIFLIVAELFSLGAGVVAGFLAALSPQLAWNSVLLLPDSISVLPVLLAVYLLTRATRNPRLITFIFIGIIVGLSCWLRANAMLLTLFFAAASLMIARKWQLALAIVGGTLLIVLPLTIRNAIVFHRFIPLSLGAGQTFLEGIADYDNGRFGVPDTDMGIMKQEAEIYQRPDYYGTLFNPDGVERERARLARGFSIVRAHPFWFAGVMGKRASSMLRLERSRLISKAPPITHSIDELANTEATTVLTPKQTYFEGSAAPGAGVVPGQSMVSVRGNEEKYGPQISSPWMTVKSGTDCVVTVPVRISSGRMRVTILNESGTVYSSQVIEALEAQDSQRTTPSSQIQELGTYDSDLLREQSEQLLKLPFVSIRDERVRIVWSNEASNAKSEVGIGVIKLYELGPARFLWTRYPRFIISAIQRLFLTAVILPPTLIGLVILILKRRTTALLILSVVPIYFFTVQSAVHTEYRYVIAVTYFLFAFAGIAIGCGVNFLYQKLTAMVGSKSVLSA
jgi:hypothetical protein